MYLMYVDESGDCGMPADHSPTNLFCLTGLVVHELRWRDSMDELTRFRHWLKGKYKVYLEDELQAADCAAFLLKQSLEPSSYMKKHGGNAYFRRLEPVLCKHASNKDPLGIVRL